MNTTCSSRSWIKKNLSIELCGHTVEVGPLDFLQPNPAVAELWRRVIKARPQELRELAVDELFDGEEGDEAGDAAKEA